jgi:hypothetical protein
MRQHVLGKPEREVSNDGKEQGCGMYGEALRVVWDACARPFSHLGACLNSEFVHGHNWRPVLEAREVLEPFCRARGLQTDHSHASLCRLSPASSRPTCISTHTGGGLLKSYQNLTFHTVR